MSGLTRWWRGMAEGVVRRRHGTLASLADPVADLAARLADRPVRAIVDAGAARGDVSRRFAAAFPEAVVLAVDPGASRRGRLTRLEAEVPRVRYRPVALAAEAGRLAFHRAADPDTSSLLAPLPGRPGGATITVEAVEEVQAVTLDALCEAEGITPDVVKFDLQGGERGAIQGARRALGGARAVLIEVLFEPLYVGAAAYWELDAMLRERGFALFQLYEPHSDADGRLLWADALYLRSAPSP